ncbi:MAG TPA: alcohol dehydrogenase catalytic domain-containing protein [Acidimicrobiales bacterium]|nr:alcohol dehydrogenase catalytic domain-containing protein [Acidimicrobiales bacterium]
MKAVVLTTDRPRLELADVADPEPGAGEVVVRVTGCGICGSDLHTASKMGAPGTVLGHEIAGVVEELGRDVAGVTVGDLVAVRPFMGCGACSYCLAGRADHCATFELIGMQRPGGFAERTVARASELFALPPEVRAEDQPLVEPFAVARRALRRGGLTAGESVIVLGGGPIGLAVTHWARALGARHITLSDPLAHRRELARSLGADVTVEPSEIRDAAGDGAPLVVECTGRPRVLDQAMQLTAVNGRVAVVGMCIANDTIFPWWGLHKELDVRFSIYYGRDDFTDTIAAFADSALSPDGLVTETIGLDQVPERFARLAARDDAGKVVITP